MPPVRTKLRILDGFRHLAPEVRKNHAARISLDKRNPPSRQREAREEDLADMLRVMDQRVSALLEDRSRLGRDLHDGILQSLYAIGLNLEASRRANPPQSHDADRSHRGVIGQINQAITGIRHMIRGLTNGTVQEFDLNAELFALKAAYDQVGRAQITLTLDPDALDVLTKEEEQEILHIVREALSNCIRHAQAAHADIAIRKRGERIRVAVSDDGTGFAAADGRARRGYGLANMEARARKIGGTLRVQSKLGRGTDIILEFALEPMLAPV